MGNQAPGSEQRTQDPEPAPGPLTPTDDPEPIPGDPQPAPDQQIHDPPLVPERDTQDDGCAK